MAKHKDIAVKVHLNQDGDMTVEPTVVHLTANDTVRWKCQHPSGALKVRMPDTSAFGETDFDAPPGAATKLGTARPPGGNPRVVHYHVEVSGIPGEPTFVDHHCPTIIIK